MKRKTTYLFTIVGTMTTGFAIGSFLTPNKIVGGGVSGISTILFHTIGIQPGVSFFILNILFLILGIAVLGKKFIFNTLIGITFLSGFTQVFSIFPIYTENLVISSVFGGSLYGLGIGMSFAAGSSTGGTDIIGRIIQTKLNWIPIGKMLSFIDGIIILISFIIFKNVELTLFGVFTLFISSYSIDLIISKLNVSRIAFVITENGEEISKSLISSSPRGVTLIDVKGAYTGSEKQMLFCALKDNETMEFQKKVLEIDIDAFIVFSESQRIKGKGFYLYK